MTKQNSRTIPIKSPDSDIEEVALAAPKTYKINVAKRDVPKTYKINVPTHKINVPKRTSNVAKREVSAPAPAKKCEAPTSELPVAKKIKDFPKSLDNEVAPFLDAPQKLSQNTMLEKIEHINDKHIHSLLQCPFIDQKVKTKLRRLKKHKVGKNLYRTEYAYSANYDDRGRRWARGPSLQNIEARDHPYRQFLSWPDYHDIDQSNSGPTIIQHLLKKHSINCPEMDDYVTNRSTILEEKKLTKQNVMEMLTYAPRKITDPLFAAIHATIYKKLIPHLQVDYPDIWRRVLASK
ncbi:hypothetical protein HK104_003721, partial [Borealophlyctis nickersoniae]